MDKFDVEDQLVNVLRSRLSLKIKSVEVYSPFSKESLYTMKDKTIQLVLDGYEVISEVDLDD